MESVVEKGNGVGKESTINHCLVDCNKISMSQRS